MERKNHPKILCTVLYYYCIFEFSAKSTSPRLMSMFFLQVALSQWLYLNVEAVVSMYEDRFDLWTLQNQLIEAPGNSQTENYSWWQRLTLRKFDTMSSPMHYTMIGQFSMPVKRMKELRALRGWYVVLSFLQIF